MLTEQFKKEQVALHRPRVTMWGGRSRVPGCRHPSVLPRAFLLACRLRGVALSRFILLISVQRQRMDLVETPLGSARFVRRFLISTSRFGIGQIRDTNRTPLGLHRVAHKAGGGWPIGVVLVNRAPVGFTWQGRPVAAIAHRVLWLEGLEPGHNRGGDVDTFTRYIYIHGVGDETTLGRPASRGCIHVAAQDLMPLYDRLPVGTLVWIAAA